MTVSPALNSYHRRSIFGFQRLVRIPSSSSVDSATSTIPIDDACCCDEPQHSKKQCRRRRVHFSPQAQNKAYQDDCDTSLEERKELCWYSDDEMRHFKRDRVRQIRGARRQQQEQGSDDDDDDSLWVNHLTNVYRQLFNADTETDLPTLLLREQQSSSSQQPLRIPLEYHGLERSILTIISRDKTWRRREVVAQVVDEQLHFARIGSRRSDNVDGCLRRASCEVSGVSTLFAHYWAELVADSNDEEEEAEV